MREIAASEAKTHFLRLLDEVEAGESFVITRHGKPIARLESERRRQMSAAEAAEQIRELGRQVRDRRGPATIEEILSARDEGRRF